MIPIKTEMWPQAWNKIWFQVSYGVWDQIDYKTWSIVHVQLDDRTGNLIRNQVKDRMKDDQKTFTV